MNVHQKHGYVTPKLRATILLDHTHVFAIKDLQEMEPFAEV